jgi:methyl-accepting chemotaxis protein
MIVRSILSRFGGEPRTVARLMQLVGDGDLATVIRLRSDDAISLMANLEAMQSGLASVVSAVRDSATRVGGSSQIEDGNASLSTSTISQRTALDDIMSSVTGLGDAVARNVEGTRRSN